MKRTAFYPIHQQLGAKIVEFAGFEMPVQYSSIFEEHKAVRNSIGLFDVSHMGEFEIRGRDAFLLAQTVTTNDVAKLCEGKAQYSTMCYPNGGIIDDLLVYHRGDRLMVVVNAANITKDFHWITSQISGLDVQVINRSDEISLLALQGPKSLATLQKLTKADLSAILYYTFIETKIADVEMIVSRTGYTGELGFELYFESSASHAEKIWNAIMNAGREFSIKPVGLGARDTLRLEMGYCLYGSDIDETTNPLEAGLGWITKLDKGKFIGRDTLLKVSQDGVKKKLVGFVMEEERAVPRHGYELRMNGTVVGTVTSGTISPTLEKGIGLGYVASQYAQPLNSLSVTIRNKDSKAKVVQVPFLKK
ncbi:MAG: glycine cleavage system aminomethyltransferase GcvT [Ignavibacteriae bacterium]|nr:glycine cleavage system aminomethyltransferase GcvT [Ignavibacteriota bacterium]